MLAKRIIPCLDIKDGKVVKGIRFEGLKDAGNPVELACRYCEEGADELVFLDISATHEKRKTLVSLVKEIASQIDIPFTIGGGISEKEDAYELLNAGADKISINSAAVQNPQLLNELSSSFGSQFVVLAIDTKRFDGKNYVYLNGGRIKTDLETESWVKQGVDAGAGEILLTSMDHDGVKQGFDVVLLEKINRDLKIPLIASGGAGSEVHFVDVFKEAGADAALAASVFHYGVIKIAALKNVLKASGINIRDSYV